MRVVAICSLVLVAACGGSEPNASSSEHRYVNKAHGYSVDQPAGWSQSTVRGVDWFAPSGEAKTEKNRKHTIVVRAAERRTELKEGTPTSKEDVIAATSQVLKSMPHAKVGASSALEGTPLPGVRFSLTFVPPGLSKTYRREHIVLMGKKLFHVIYTAPVDEAVDETAFNSIVNTLREEG